MGPAGDLSPSGVAARAKQDDPGHLELFLTPIPRHLSWTHSTVNEEIKFSFPGGLRESSCSHSLVRADSWVPRLLSAALCPSCTVLVSCCRAQIASAPAPSDGFSSTLTQSSLHPEVPGDNTKIFSVFHHSCLQTPSSLSSVWKDNYHPSTKIVHPCGIFLKLSCSSR